MENRARAGSRASFVGLIVNALLAGIKITVGTMAGSVSILADGINNLSDTGSVLISFFSLKMAQKPEDKEHPFGHARIEYIGTLLIALIILYAGIDLLRSSVNAIVEGSSPLFSWWIAGLTALSIPAKVFLWRFYLKIGRKYEIPSLLAASQDSVNDVVSTSAVLLGLFATHFLNLKADGWVGLAVSLFILYGGFKLVRETATSIIGGTPNVQLGKAILDIVKKYPRITGVHDFMLHDYGPGRSIASLHVEVSAEEKLIEIHEVIDQLEQEITTKFQMPITIHIDPTLPPDAPGYEVMTRIQEYLLTLHPGLSLHDFRIVPGKRVIKLVFDVVVPLDYHNKDLISQIDAFAKEIDQRYECHILLDRDYFVNTAEDDL